MSSDRGQALVETILLALLLLVPLLWLLGVLGDLHRTALAATAAARDAGVAAARAPGTTEAAAAIDEAIRSAFLAHGLSPSPAHSRWVAAPRFERGARIEVGIRYPVTVLQAPLLGRVSGPSIWVDARHVARVHPFISRP